MRTDDIYKRRGYWWRTMGFTKTHVAGVFLTESLLATLGTVLVVAGVLEVFQNTLAWLLAAVCVFLLQISVLLSSILSLLFYLGARVDRFTEHDISTPFIKTNDLA